MTQPSHAELARVVRDHAGRLAASLVHLVGDFSTAEDLVQDAIEAALTPLADRRHPATTRRLALHRRAPPRAWTSCAARHRHREKTRPRRLAGRARTGRPAPAHLHLLPPGPAARGPGRADPAGGVRADDRPDRQGVPRARRARWRNGSPAPNGRSATPASRTGSRPPTSSPDRLAEVLAVIYLLFNEGYLSSGGHHGAVPRPGRRRRLPRHTAAPTDAHRAEVTGLLALIRLHRARRRGPLHRRRRDHPAARPGPRPGGTTQAIADATRLIARAAPPSDQGHTNCRRRSSPATPKPHVGRHRLDPDRRALRHAPAPRPVTGDPAAPRDRAALRHRTRSRLAERRHPRRRTGRLPPVPRHPSRTPPRDLGHHDQARTADQRALQLTANPAEQHLLRQRLT